MGGLKPGFQGEWHRGYKTVRATGSQPSARAGDVLPRWPLPTIPEGVRPVNPPGVSEHLPTRTAEGVTAPGRPGPLPVLPDPRVRPDPAQLLSVTKKMILF